MNKKAAILAGVLVLGLLGVFSIGKKKDVLQDVKETDIVMVQDKNGEQEIVKNPKVVVTFDYGTLDILDNMGIEVAGLPKGSLPKSLSKYSDDKYANLGDLKEPDFEAINELNPDLIIISGRQEDMYDKFSEIAKTIFLDIDGKQYTEDFAKNMETLGAIFDKEDYVKEELEDLENQMNEVKDRVQENNANALTVMVNDGSLSVFSDKSRFGMIYNQLGFENKDKNIEESNHGQQVTFEYLVEQNPEYIFVVDRGDATGGESSAKSLFDNDLIKTTDAYKNDKIVYLSSQAWYTISGGIDSTQVMIDDVKNAIK